MIFLFYSQQKVHPKGKIILKCCIHLNTCAITTGLTKKYKSKLSDKYMTCLGRNVSNLWLKKRCKASVELVLRVWCDATGSNAI